MHLSQVSPSDDCSFTGKSTVGELTCNIHCVITEINMNRADSGDRNDTIVASELRKDDHRRLQLTTAIIVRFAREFFSVQFAEQANVG